MLVQLLSFAFPFHDHGYCCGAHQKVFRRCFEARWSLRRISQLQSVTQACYLVQTEAILGSSALMTRQFQKLFLLFLSDCDGLAFCSCQMDF